MVFANALYLFTSLRVITVRMIPTVVALTLSEAHMSGFGRVIDGGSRMTKGLTKGINGKLDNLEDTRERRKSLADTVKAGFKVNNLSAPTWNNIQVGQTSTKFGGKKGNNMTSPKKPEKV